MEEKIKKSLTNTTKGKTAGPDGIIVEMPMAL